MLLSCSLPHFLNPLLALPLFPFLFLYCVADYYSGAAPPDPKAGAPRMTVKGGTSQACAACKYQRRKCTSDCPLAPFFPPDKPKMFQNAHRLYGVSNILKIINHLNREEKVEAMKSIIFQSDMREKYPVHGCAGIIAHLAHQIRLADAELQAVRRQLEICRQHHQNQISSSSQSLSPPQQYSPSSQFQQLQISGDNKGVLPLFNPHPQYQTFANTADNNFIDSRDTWFPQQYNNTNSNILAIQPQSFSPEFPDQQQVGVFEDYEDISPNLFEAIDDREVCESSCESLHIAENDLKDAAAGFSLTSIN